MFVLCERKKSLSALHICKSGHGLVPVRPLNVGVVLMFVNTHQVAVVTVHVSISKRGVCGLLAF